MKTSFPLHYHVLLFTLSLLLSLAAFPKLASAQSADDGFNPGANSWVLALSIQPDGMILVGGTFSVLDGQARSNLGQLYPDGALNTDFAPALDGRVEVIERQTDGALLIGGRFTEIDGHPRGRIARLDADGALDEDFDPNANDAVVAISPQADKKILIGGEFTTVSGQPQSYLARVDEDGALDEDFQPLINGAVQAMTVQPDGKILVGGEFTEVNGVARNRLARLLPDGSLDLDFVADVTGWPNDIYSIALQADGRILVGGRYVEIGGVSRQCVARLNSDGTLDADFNPDLEREGGEPFLRSLLVKPDGTIVIAGRFDSVNGVPVTHLARLLPDGSLDETFAPSPSLTVHALALQPDQKLVFGGLFETVSGKDRENLARVYPCGTLDTTLDPGPVPPQEGRYVGAITHQPDGRIIAAGFFRHWNQEPRTNLVRLLPDGELDDEFTPHIGGEVDIRALALQRNGNVLIAGSFDQISGHERRNIARLHADGTLDMDFNPIALGGALNCFLLVQDDKILVGGGLTNLAGHTRYGLGLLHSDGTLDTNFVTETEHEIWVSALAKAADGNILVGGSFLTIGGQNRSHLAKVCWRTGNVIAAFNPPEINGLVTHIAVLRNGDILIGGHFTMIDGQPRERLALLKADGTLQAGFTPSVNGPINTMALQADGGLLIGGWFTEVNGEQRNKLARLTSSGLLDSGFIADTDGTAVVALLVQPDGKVLVGGNFEELAGVPRRGFGRLSVPQGSYQSLRVDDTFSEIRWDHRRWEMISGPLPLIVPRGSGPEANQVRFYISYDGTNWYRMIDVERSLSGWKMTDKHFPAQATIYIRGRAEYGAGTGGNSVSAWESVRQIFVDTLPELRIRQIEKGPPVTIFYGLTTVGQTYRLQYAVDIESGLWEDVPGTEPEQGSGYEHWIADEDPPQQRIYRILAE